MEPPPCLPDDDGEKEPDLLEKSEAELRLLLELGTLITGRPPAGAGRVRGVCAAPEGAEAFGRPAEGWLAAWLWFGMLPDAWEPWLGAEGAWKLWLGLLGVRELRLGAEGAWELWLGAEGAKLWFGAAGAWKLWLGAEGARKLCPGALTCPAGRFGGAAGGVMPLGGRTPGRCPLGKRGGAGTRWIPAG